jgi:hypothetical protein
MARSGRIEGEVSVDEYRRLWADAIAASRDTLSEGLSLRLPKMPMEFCQHINLAFVHIRCPREERFNPLNLRVSTGLNFCLAR